MTNQKIKSYSLPNGLRVNLHQIKRTPTVCVTVGYHVGSKNEQRGMTGIAHLFEHLMFDNVNSASFDKLYDVCGLYSGAENNAYTTYDQTVYYISLPNHQLELGLWLESQRMNHFSINEIALKTQQSVVTEEINQNVFNQPYGLLSTKINELLFDKSCFYNWEVYGSIEDVNNFTLEKANEFYNSYYSPKNAVVTIVGDFEFSNTESLIEKYFGSIAQKNGTMKPYDFSPSMCLTNQRSLYIDSIPLEGVNISFHIPKKYSEDYLVGNFVSSLFGKGKSTKLYNDLVREQQICSEVYSYVDAREESSILTIQAIASDEDITAERIEDSLRTSLQSIHNNKFAQKELQKVQTKSLTSLAYQKQLVEGISDFITTTTMLKDSPDYVFSLEEQYNDITLEQCNNFIENYLQFPLSNTLLIKRNNDN
jgi:zinc protease